MEVQKAWHARVELAEARPGAKLCVTVEGVHGVEGAYAAIKVGDRYAYEIMLDLLAPEITFESNWHGAHAWPQPTFFTLRVGALYDATLVEIFHHGFERLGVDAADALEGYESGWDLKHLKALRQIVA